MIGKSEHMMMIADFNCQKSSMEAGEESQGSKLLHMAMDNIITLWIEEYTGFKGGNISSRIELLCTNKGIRYDR